MDFDKVEVGQTLSFTSPYDGQRGPVIRATQVEGKAVHGIVLDAKESPYTVGLPYLGLIESFEKEEQP